MAAPSGYALPVSAPDRRIWFDGEFVPWQDAQVHLLSHALARGSLVFDYMSLYETERGAAIFRLADHVERFCISCELVGLPLERTADEISAACFDVARANPGAKVLKLNAFLPSVEVDVVPADARVALAVAAFDPQQDVMQRKAKPPPPPPAAIKLWLEKERRQRRPDILHPHAKVAANYASPMLAKWRARARGFDDVLLLDEQGCIAEAPTSNFFLVDEAGALCTPPEPSVLLGVTRRSVLELAAAEGLRVEQRALAPAALDTAREAFLTGTSAGVLPVACVDGRPFRALCPGPVTEALAARFRRVTEGRDPDFLHWLSFVSP